MIPRARALAGCALLGAIALGGSPAPVDADGPAERERRIGALALEIQARARDRDWDGARQAIDRMAALDADHPKPYLRTVLLQARLKRLRDAPELMDRLGSPAGPGRMYGAGLLAYFRKQYGEAAGHFSRALKTYRSHDHAAGQAACHTALGNLYMRDDAQLDRAIGEYESAVSALQEIDDRFGLADVLANLAKLERRKGRPAAAAARHREILALRESLGDEEGQARSWHEIGISLHEAGDGRGAIEALEQAASLQRELGNLGVLITTLKDLAELELHQDQLESALRRLREAESLAVELQDRKRQAGILRQLGVALITGGRAGQARAPLSSSISLWRELDLPEEQAASAMWLGTALSRQGELGRAKSFLLQALEVAQRSGNRKLEAGTRTELGNVLWMAGEMTQALVLQQRARELHGELGDRRGELTNLNNLGVLYFSMGDLRRARRDVEQALRLAGELQDGEARGRGHNNLGVLLAEDGRLETALSELRRAAQVWDALGDRRGKAGVQANIAATLSRLGRPEEAAAEVRRALSVYRDLGDRRGHASALNQTGEQQLASGRPAASARAHRQALDLAEKAGLSDETLRARAGLAAAFEALGEHETALGHALRAVEQVEAVRSHLETSTFRMSFLAGKIDHYERAIQLALGATGDRVSMGFELTERARARSLLDLLVESRARMRDDVDPALRHRETEILDRLTSATVDLARAEGFEALDAARQRRDRAEEALERLEIEMRRRAPAYGEIVYPGAVSLQEIQTSVLETNEVLLEYFLGEEHAWLWVVDRKDATLHALPHPDRIRSQVISFVELAGAAGVDLAGRSLDEEAAERISKDLLPPAPLGAGRRLVVVPDGPLHHLPFGALRVGDRYLIEDHEIVVVPSAATLRLMRTQLPPGQGTGFLGIGDPVRGDLPFSRLEVDRIAGLFPEAARQVLLGPAATKANLRALDLERFRFVHFATHGWLRGTDLARNGLMLTAGAGDPGSALLSQDEVVGLRLSSDVVVLSACRSGAGELLRGEGLVGLTRSFLYAGARSVVVSLWNVGDRSTVDFMTELYREMRAGGSPAASLRRAKLSFLRSDRLGRRALRHWAPFVLVGNPAPAKGPVNPETDGPT